MIDVFLDRMIKPFGMVDKYSNSHKNSCFRVDTGDCIAVFEGHTDGVYCLKVFGGILFSGAGDKSVRVWDARVQTK